jgi:hypothetical protein
MENLAGKLLLSTTMRDLAPISADTMLEGGEGWIVG